MVFEFDALTPEAVIEFAQTKLYKTFWCVQHTPYSCRANLKLIFSNPSLCARHFKSGF